MKTTKRFRICKGSEAFFAWWGKWEKAMRGLGRGRKSNRKLVGFKMCKDCCGHEGRVTQISVKEKRGRVGKCAYCKNKVLKKIRNFV